MAPPNKGTNKKWLFFFTYNYAVQFSERATADLLHPLHEPQTETHQHHNSVCVFLHNYVSLVFLRFRLVTFILCGLWTHRWPHHWHHQVTGSFFIIHPVPQGPAGVDQAPAGLKTASHCDLWPSSSSSSSWSCFCFSLWTKCVCIFLNAHTNVPILRSSPLKSILLLQGVLEYFSVIFGMDIKGTHLPRPCKIMPTGASISQGCHQPEMS